MKIKYNEEKFKEIVNNISIITGLCLAVADINFNIFYKPEKNGENYCDLIQNTKQGCEKCRFSDVILLKRCAEEKKAVSHICHAGLLDTAVPIFKNGMVVGYIIIGRLRTEETGNILSRLPDNEKRKYMKLVFYNQHQLDCAINLFSHIVFENAIEIEFDEFINGATEYIENNLSKKISVNDICENFFVSKNYLYKSFHNFYNCTVNEYISSRRIERAKELLKNTKDAAYIISEKIGFENYTYFCRLFKNKTGFTPKEFRKLNITTD